MKRDDVIKKVADVVGPLHSVDLKNFDLLVLVEIYRVSRRIFGHVLDLLCPLRKGIADD